LLLEAMMVGGMMQTYVWFCWLIYLLK